MKSVYLILILTGGICGSSFAQSNVHRKKIAASGTVMLDTAYVFTESIRTDSALMKAFLFDAQTCKLKWIKETNADSVWIEYRTLNRRIELSVPDKSFINIIQERKSAGKKDAIKEGGLQYSGTVGRNMTVGNNQNASFQSQMNLQVYGYIADSVKVTASLSDNNLPIQPDGTTQQLNQFDKVNIRFEKKAHVLEVGDAEIRSDDLKYLRFAKKVQGASYRYENGQQKMVAGAAVAKGKYTRNNFNGQEGNQGPYRLQGQNNELFMMILAGTEKIYVNGVQLERGENKDYIINYNTAEIIFTSKRMISKDDRISAEFEYASANYVNSILFIEQQQKVSARTVVAAGIYSNADAKNSPVNQTFSAAQRSFLNAIGNNISNAFYTDTVSASVFGGRILYRQKDTITAGESFHIFQFSNDTLLPLYSLSFSYAGKNKGNYMQQLNDLLQPVFIWVAPLNGIAQGDYEPGIFLITPKKTEIISVAVTHAGSKQLVSANYAYSRNNVNTLSAHSPTEEGSSFSAALQKNIRWNAYKTVQLNASAEHTGKTFTPVERLRSTEFYREWGLSLSPVAENESYARIGANLKDSANNETSILFRYLLRDHYKGYNLQLKNLQHFAKGDYSILASRTVFNKDDTLGNFLSANINAQRLLSNYTIVLSAQSERSVMQYEQKFLPGSFSYYTMKGNIKKGNTLLEFFTRNNAFATEGKMQETDRSYNYRLQSVLYFGKEQTLSFNTALRTVVSDTSKKKHENNLLARVEYASSFLKRGLRQNMIIDIGKGREQQRSVQYFETAAGRGVFAWIDKNNNGVKEPDEFVQANFSDQAKFLRVYIPTNSFVNATGFVFSYDLAIDPSLFINTKAGRNSFFTKSFFTGSFSVDQKIITDQLFALRSLYDSNVIRTANSLYVHYAFNRFSTEWGIDADWRATAGGTLLNYGIEKRSSDEMRLKIRKKITNAIQLQTECVRTKSDYVPFGNLQSAYSISGYQSTPKIVFSPNDRYRLQGSYEYVLKKNAPVYGGGRSVSGNWMIDYKQQLNGSWNVYAKTEYRNIQFTGLRSSVTEYVLLNGLAAGKNFLWTLDVQKKIRNNFEISFQYEGRKPARNEIVHFGRAAVRAIL